MDLSIIIVNYKERGFLRQCLKGIERAVPKVSYEVIVVDNNSNDESAEMVEEFFPAVRLLRHTINVGLAKGNNAGARLATGRYLLFLNCDIAVFKGTLEALVRYLDEHPTVGIVAPKLLNPDRSVQISCYNFPSLLVPILRRSPLGRFSWAQPILRRYLMLDYDHDTTQPIDWALGAALMVRRRAFDQIGGMDERYFLYLEDVDLCRQMWMRGWEVVYGTFVSLIHYHQRTSATSTGFGPLLNWHTRRHIISGIKYYTKYFRQPLPNKRRVPRHV